MRRIFALFAMLSPLCLSASGEGVSSATPPRLLASASADRQSGIANRPVEPGQGFTATHARDQRPPGSSPRIFPRYLKPLPDETPAVGAWATERLVLLTFDDGPDLQGTSLIMNELDRRKLHGVFFVMGQHIVRNRSEDLARRELLRKLATHGHLVGNHTMNHKNLCRSRGVLAEEVDHAAELITYATGVRPLLFRSPYGARCHSLDRALAVRDLVQVGWNADPREWRGNSERSIVSYVTNLLARADGPVILLLHDKNLAAVQALPRILDWIEEEQARVTRVGGIPIRIVDGSVLLPERTESALTLPSANLGWRGRVSEF